MSQSIFVSSSSVNTPQICDIKLSKCLKTLTRRWIDLLNDFEDGAAVVWLLPSDISRGHLPNFYLMFDQLKTAELCKNGNLDDDKRN